MTEQYNQTNINIGPIIRNEDFTSGALARDIDENSDQIFVQVGLLASSLILPSAAGNKSITVMLTATAGGAFLVGVQTGEDLNGTTDGTQAITTNESFTFTPNGSLGWFITSSAV